MTNVSYNKWQTSAEDIDIDTDINIRAHILALRIHRCSFLQSNNVRCGCCLSIMAQVQQVITALNSAHILRFNITKTHIIQVTLRLSETLK